MSCVLMLAYVVMLIKFTFGWRHTPEFVPNGKATILVSLIVCCRNEEKVLPRLLESIARQRYKNLEVVFADDYSADKTSSILTQFAQEHSNVKIVTPPKCGKKQALAAAVRYASGELICCTDADCVLTPEHISLFADFFESTRADMILGGVCMRNNSWFERLQTLEFLSLQASGAGAAGIGCPILANGANMAFTPQAWEFAQNSLHNETPSGDDQFLLFALKKCAAKILFLRHQSAVVFTDVCTTLNLFFLQRSRWVSKCTRYTDWQAIVVALLVFFVAVLPLFWLVASCFIFYWWWAFVLFFAVKYFSDTLFLKQVLPFFKEQKLGKNTFVLSLFYPFYVIFSVIMGFCKKIQWKNRTF